MTNTKLTAVVVTYRSERTLAAAIASARRCYDMGIMKTIFVDNASPDRTRELLSEQQSWARVIHNDGNVGFSRGCNRGLADVQTPYTIFLNPDAALEPEAAAKLIEFMDATPTAGICGPAIVEGDGGLQVAGDRPTPWKIVSRHWSRSANRFFSIKPGAEPFRCGWVCGAALVIRTELARELGGFDPRFFLYFEEMDLCKRAEELGWQIWAVGTATAHHLAGASSDDDGTRVGGCIAQFYYESRYYYLRKHHGWFAASASEFADYVMLLAGSVRDIVGGRGVGRLRPRLQAAPFRSPRRVVSR